ncbi:MAG: hypothetical protein HXS48_04220 [Theionarchaea archaeon]|nr:hypothetical protein [Theionarchaea archaeon]
MHRYPLVLLLVLFTGCISQADNPVQSVSETEEYAVYTALIKERYTGWVIVIKDHTSSGRSPSEDLSKMLQRAQQEMSGVEQETLDDFLAKNGQSHPLGDYFNIKTRIVLISDEERKKIFGESFGWIKFYVRYPLSDGILTFSRVGFNDEMDQALAYIGHSKGWLEGIGYYVLLTKENGVWTIQDKMVLWIS